MGRKRLPSYMVTIDTKAVIKRIYQSMTLTDMAVILLPQYEKRTDAYHSMRYWFQTGRMPRRKYKRMTEVLDEIERKRTSDKVIGHRNRQADV